MTSKILLSGGCVLTLGAKTPNFTRADVLIDDETVAEIGTGLRARDAEQVDATDTIVMPGFVDTHRHAWRSLFRNLGAWPPGRRDGGRSRRRVPARRRLRRHADRLARRGRGGDHHRRRLVDIRSDDAPRGRRAPGPRRCRTANGVRPCRAQRDGGPEIAASAIRRLVARLDRGGRAARPRIAFGSVVPGATDLDRVAAEWALARELGLADPRARRSGDARATERSPSSPSGGSWVRTSRSCTARRSTTPTSTRSPSSGACGVARAVERDGGRSRTPPVQQLIDRDIRPGPRGRRRAVGTG